MLKKICKIISSFLCVFILFFVPIFSYAGAINDSNDTFSDSGSEISKADSINIGFFAYPGYHNIDSNGEYSGYGYEFYEILSRFTNTDISYVGYELNWRDNLRLLNKGEIDILVCFDKTDEFDKEYLFSSNSIGYNSTRIVVSADDSSFSYKNYSTYVGKRYGYIVNNSDLDKFVSFCKQHNIPAEMVPFSDIEQMENALDDSDINGMVLSSNISLRDNQIVLDEFSRTPIYLMTTKANAELMTKIDDALDLLIKYEPELINTLSEKYFSSDLAMINFTSEEISYINSHKENPIYATCNTNMEPICYFEKGKFRGIIADYIDLIEEKTGLVIEVVDSSDSAFIMNFKPIDLYVDSIDDVLSKNEKDLRLTIPYLNLPISRIMLRDTSNYDSVGLSSDSFSEYCYRQNSDENTKIVYYSSTDDCVDGIIHGDVMAAYLPSYVSQLYLYKNYSGKLAMNNLPAAFSLSFGLTDKNDDVLCSILNKVINSVSNDEIEDIISLETIYDNNAFSFIRLIYENLALSFTVFTILLVLILSLIYLIIRSEYIRRERNSVERTINILRNAFLTNDIVGEIDLTNSKDKIIYVYDIYKDSRTGLERIEKKLYEKSFDDIISHIHTEDKNDLYDILSDESCKNIIQSGLSKYIEIRYLPDKSNDYHYYAVSLQGLTPNKDHPNSIAIFVKNIDSVMKEEEEKKRTLTLALNTARHFSKVKSEFLTQMSHDLRTPMNAICGMSGIAQMSLENTAQVKKCLEQIDKSSEELIRIVDQILDMTNLEQGELKLTMEKVNLSKLLSVTLSRFNEIRDKKKISLFISNSITHEIVETDKNRAEQLFYNILSNAFEYIQPEGKIDVILSESESAYNNKHFYNFTVTDNGYGMDEETLSKLFVPFERGNQFRYTTGTGLGMSIVKTIVDALGGVIKVESQEGKGTKVFVSVCLENDDDNSNLDDFEALMGQKAIVISVDDSFIDKTKVFLKDMEIVPYVFENSIDAINNIKSDTDKFVMIFMNTLMPISDDFDIVKSLREAFGELPVIIDATPFEFANYKVRAVDVGLDIFVNDNYSNSQLKLNFLDNYKKRYDTFISMKKKSGEGKRALVVEDVEINRIFASTIVEMKGFIVDSCENGKEAVDILNASEEGYYSLVLMDIQMPVMDGYKATDIIRSSDREYLKNIPIVAMSANAFAEDALKSKEHGMNEHISKPVDLSKFSKVIDNIFEGK